MRRCAYCGKPIDDRSTACRNHGYLIRLDARYLGDLAHLQQPAPRPHLDKNGGG